MSAPPNAPRRLRGLLAWLAPALLCGVAALQVVVTQQTQLSPWKLGGFGMYSGVDTVRSRWIRLRVRTPAGPLPVVFERVVEDRAALAHLARNVRSLPDDGSLAGLGQALLAGPGVWADCTPARLGGAQGRVSGHHVRLLAPQRVRPEGCVALPVRGLDLEVWRYRYDSAERRLRGELLAQATVARSRP